MTADGVCSRPRPRARSSRSTPTSGPRAGTAPLVRTARQPRQLLRAVGQDLGVPGAAQGATCGWRRELGGTTCARSCRWSGEPPSVTTSSRTSRPCGAGSRTPARCRGRPRAQAGPAAACATSSSPSSSSSSCTAAPTPPRSGSTLGGPWPARPTATWAGTTPRDLATPTGSCAASSTCSSSTSCGAPTSLPDDPASLRRSAGHAPAMDLRPARRPGGGAGRASGGSNAREVRRLHEKLFYRPLLQAVARLPRRGAAHPRRGEGPPRGARLPRPRRRVAPPRGAHRRCEPPRGDPAHAAAGDARLVRRRRRPGPRAARVPAGSATSSARPRGTCGCSATRAWPPSAWRGCSRPAATPATSWSARPSRW